MEEVEGGSDCEQHVVVVYLVQDDENQIAYLETEAKKIKNNNKKKHSRVLLTANTNEHIRNVNNYTTQSDQSFSLKKINKKKKLLLSNGDFVRMP